MSSEIQDVKKEFTVINGGLSIPDSRYIDDVFGKTGYLSKQFDSYTPREGQIAIARAIDTAIRMNKHLIAEGPTGTGKSLAYSVPAAFHAIHAGKKVCIVTANKNLQRQVYQKDLALLRKAVPWQFSYAIRKGMGSYLCLRDFNSEKWRELTLEYLSRDDDEMLQNTLLWAQGTKTGDYEESPGPQGKLWRAFSTNREECDGRHCEDYDDCYVRQAKDKAATADIIVTNYHLLFIHLSLGPGSKILPPFDVVILDEAHRAAKIARDFFGTEINYGSLYRCVTNMHMVKVRGYGARGKRLRDDIMMEIHRLWGFLSAKARAYDNILGDKWNLDSEKLEGLLHEASQYYREVSHALGYAEGMETGATSVEEAQRLVEGKHHLELSQKCLERERELFEFRATSGKGTVYFIEGSGQDDKPKVKLKSKAVEVAAKMHHGLFKRFPSVIQTSATLAIKGGGTKSEFEYVRREMGMKGLDNVAEITVPSPFNWKRQGLLVIPKSMPEYKYQDKGMVWEKAICDHFEKIVMMSKGRTMGLFTSLRMMEMVAERLRKVVPYNVYCQGEATNREQAEKFQADISSVLLGTESFSEGISIEGEACTTVVLDKIPFISAKDPVMWGIERDLKERGVRNTNSFDSYSLPEAIISFKQRVGRLIRTVSDVGVVVVLDKRLHTKRYRHQFTKSVPFDKVHDSINDIEPFLRKVGAL